MVQGVVEYQYLIDNDMTIIKKSGFEKMLTQIDRVEEENKLLRNTIRTISEIGEMKIFDTDKLRFLACISFANETLGKLKYD